MCGIVGLFLKDKALEPKLGSMLTDMLVTMTDRGPDSAGIAIYGSDVDSKVKLTIQSDDPATDFTTLEKDLEKSTNAQVSMSTKDTHAVLEISNTRVDDVRAALSELRPNVRIMSTGDIIEIYKEVGLPKDVAERFDVASMSGTHGIDQCLVHNGSLSNHNSLRRKLIREGMTFETENDTEVGAAYLSHKMQNGSNLGEALESSLEDLDGFFTFVVGTKDGFGVVRDPIACKPAVMAETDQYVAFGSEYRALVNLPGIEDAKVWEPEPATVYFWSH